MYLSNTHEEAKDFSVYDMDREIYLADVIWVNEETGFCHLWVDHKRVTIEGEFILLARDGSSRLPSH